MLSYSLKSQHYKIDSLNLVFKSLSNDSDKVLLLHHLASASDSVYYSFKALELAKKLNFKKGISQSLLDIGRHYYFNGKEDVALDYLIKSVKIAEEIGNKKIMASAYRYIGFVYRNNDSYTAEDYYKKSLKMCEEIGDKISASYALSAIGNIYEGGFEGATEKNKKALNYYLKSLAIREKIGSMDEIASSLNETSRVYNLIGLHDKAIELRLKGLEIAEKSQSSENIVYLTNLIGKDYSFRLHNYNKGLGYQLKAYEISKSLKNNFDVMQSITKGIAFTYSYLKDLKKSNEFFLLSNILSDSIESQMSKNQYNLSGIKHDLEKELEKQKLLLKDSEIQTAKAEAERQTTLRNSFFIGFALILIFSIFVFIGNRQKQKVNQELALRNNEIRKAYQTLETSENNFKQITETINDIFYLYNIIEKKYEYISPNCFSIFGLTPEYFYDGKSMKVVVHTDDLEKVIAANIKVDSGIAYDIEYRIIVENQVKWIEEKSSPIFDDNGLLIRNSGICSDITQRKTDEAMLVKKNKDITDSILYARIIQNAILVPRDEISKKIKEFFILSKPKDIVGGDFYFYKETKNSIILAVADCTGHGVPAGFMSMIGNAFLNEIVSANEDISPAEILEQLSEKIIKSLNQNRNDSESKDGMDIAILCFENKSSTVQYAGAQNSLYLIRNKELTEIKADLFPVGISSFDKESIFTNNKLELQKGDSLYIFSDGYADQFGGELSRKFMKKQMKELLLSIQEKSMIEQEEILDKTFNNWKGKLDQVDDMLVIGVRV
ncbi:MAG: SpoIIE family protein phosphatase [Bacteroidota bacterium]|nr:SpoIIE family protein phosphatase [Bacteroidota bacterium]